MPPRPAHDRCPSSVTAQWALRTPFLRERRDIRAGIWILAKTGFGASCRGDGIATTLGLTSWPPGTELSYWRTRAASPS